MLIFHEGMIFIKSIFTSSVRCIQSCEMRRIISMERTLVNIATYGAEFSSYEQDVAILVHTVWQLTPITVALVWLFEMVNLVPKCKAKLGSNCEKTSGKYSFHSLRTGSRMSVQF